MNIMFEDHHHEYDQNDDDQESRVKGVKFVSPHNMNFNEFSYATD